MFFLPLGPMGARLKAKLSKTTNLPFALTTGSSLRLLPLATSAPWTVMSTGFWAITFGPYMSRQTNAARINFRLLIIKLIECGAKLGTSATSSWISEAIRTEGPYYGVDG